MDITDIYPTIKIVPMEKCLAHEGIVPKWVDRISSNILDNGIMKNPVIVAEEREHYIVIDGMHRFAAFQKLEMKDIMVCEIDYHSDGVALESWDAFTFKPIHPLTLFSDLFPAKDGYTIKEVGNVSEARMALLERKCLLVAGSKEDEKFFALHKQVDREKILDELISVTERIDTEIDLRNLKVVYVENTVSDEKFRNSDAQSIIIRPRFTKKEVLEKTLNKGLFPRKSTRHLIPDRPLRVDLDLSLLRANDISLEVKNRLLDEHLNWCLLSGRVRYYPESVYVFSD